MNKGQAKQTQNTPATWHQVMSASGALREIVGRFLNYNESFRFSGVPLRDYFSSEKEGAVWASWPTCEEEVNHMVMMVFCQCLFETEGGLMGSATRRARPGDRIAVIFGCDMPLVLRPKDDKYEIIGGCFVDGLMNGEVSAAVKRGDLNPKTICFC